MLRWRGCKSRLWFFRKSSRVATLGHGGRGIHCEDGATMVEFALIASVLLAMIFGIFESCLALHTHNYVSEVAREGTRYAIVRGSACTGFPDCNATQAQIQTYVQSIQYPGTNPAKHMTVTASWFSPSGGPPATTWIACTKPPCNQPGNLVQVGVKYTFPLSIPFWSGATINLSSTSQMVISQ